MQTALLFIPDEMSVLKIVSGFDGRQEIEAAALHTHAQADEQLRTQLESTLVCGASKVQLLVATFSICRGLDLPRVSHVFLLQPPKHPTHYLHICGRTGRHGKHGILRGHTITVAAPGAEARRMRAIAQYVGVSLEGQVGSEDIGNSSQLIF